MTATVGEVYLTHTRFINSILILHRVVFTTMCFMHNWDIYQMKQQTTSAQWLICRCGCHVTDFNSLSSIYYTVLLAALNIVTGRKFWLVGVDRKTSWTQVTGKLRSSLPKFVGEYKAFSLAPPPPPPQCSVSMKPNWSSIIICNQSMTVLPPSFQFCVVLFPSILINACRSFRCFGRINFAGIEIKSEPSLMGVD